MPTGYTAKLYEAEPQSFEGGHLMSSSSEVSELLTEVTAAIADASVVIDSPDYECEHPNLLAVQRAARLLPQLAEVVRAQQERLDEPAAPGAPEVTEIAFGQVITLTGQVYMLSMTNGREGADAAHLPNGEYLVGLHAHPRAEESVQTSSEPPATH